MSELIHTNLTIRSDYQTLGNLVFRMARRDSEAKNHWQNEPTPLSLWNIIHPPADKLDDYYGDDKNNKYHWFNWNVNNWGTKWDCGNSELMDYSEDGFVIYDFDTVWASPLLALNNLAKIYPEAQMMVLGQSPNSESFIASWEKGMAVAYTKI